MSQYDDYIERDSKGNVRVPLLKMDERNAKKLIEFIYLNTNTNQNFGFRERPETFGEYGKISRVGKKRDQPNKDWCWEDVKVVLENYKEDNHTIGELLGRSFMAIRHAKDEIRLLFDRWVDENPNLCEGLTRNQQIELYGEQGYTARKGDEGYVPPSRNN